MKRWLCVFVGHRWEFSYVFHQDPRIADEQHVKCSRCRARRATQWMP